MSTKGPKPVFTEEEHATFADLFFKYRSKDENEKITQQQVVNALGKSRARFDRFKIYDTYMLEFSKELLDNKNTIKKCDDKINTLDDEIKSNVEKMMLLKSEISESKKHLVEIRKEASEKTNNLDNLFQQRASAMNDIDLFQGQKLQLQKNIQQKQTEIENSRNYEVEKVTSAFGKLTVK